MAVIVVYEVGNRPQHDIGPHYAHNRVPQTQVQHAYGRGELAATYR